MSHTNRNKLTLKPLAQEGHWQACYHANIPRHIKPIAWIVENDTSSRPDAILGQMKYNNNFVRLNFRTNGGFSKSQIDQRKAVAALDALNEK